mmetsp:Transcript_42349/g.76852  ORF Transcript_42349/g.76852 Transcript_42349/m.76852 type:complete len:306 (+) Transcript_42349:590-1507(+)
MEERLAMWARYTSGGIWVIASMMKPGLRFCRLTSGSDAVPMTSSTSMASSSDAARCRSSEAKRSMPSGPVRPANGGGRASWPAAAGASFGLSCSSGFSSFASGGSSGGGRLVAVPLGGSTLETSGCVSQSSSRSDCSTPCSSGKSCRIADMAAFSSSAATGPNTSPEASASCGAAATSCACLSLIVISSSLATYFKPLSSGSNPPSSKFCSKDAPRKAFKAASCRALRLTRGEARSGDFAASRCASPYASTIFNCVSHTSFRKSCDLRLKIRQAPRSKCPAERRLTAWDNLAKTCASKSLRFAST